jgi:hypothetical protein
MLTFSAIILYSFTILSLLAFKVSDPNVKEDMGAATLLLIFGFLSAAAGTGLIAKIVMD